MFGVPDFPTDGDQLEGLRASGERIQPQPIGGGIQPANLGQIIVGIPDVAGGIQGHVFGVAAVGELPTGDRIQVGIDAD